MAKNNNLKDFLTDIANKIREKCGVTGKINPQDFVNYIGGSGNEGGISTKVGDVHLEASVGITNLVVIYLTYENGVYKRREIKNQTGDGIDIANIVLNTPVVVHHTNDIDIYFQEPADESIKLPIPKDYANKYPMFYITEARYNYYIFVDEV